MANSIPYKGLKNIEPFTGEVSSDFLEYSFQ